MHSQHYYIVKAFMIMMTTFKIENCKAFMLHGIKDYNNIHNNVYGSGLF